METFEQLHPRDTAGTFVAKTHTAPETHLQFEEQTGAEVLAGRVFDRTVNERRPAGVAATRAALRNIRGEADGAIRQVTLTWASVPVGSNTGAIDVVGPKDGRSLIVNIFSGKPHLHVVSGSVVIIANSAAGHSLTAGSESTVVVLAKPGRKVNVTAEADSVVDLYAEEDSRGFQSIQDGALFTMHGDYSGMGVSDNAR